MSKIEYTDVRTQELIQNLLQSGETTVSFTKKDGSERVMRCTLNQSLIPGDKMPKTDGTSTKKKSDLVQAVFDLDKNEWRSFSWSSVTEVTS